MQLSVTVCDNMNKRAPIQKQHERAVMLGFLDWYNNEEDVSYKIYSEPDPPDALIKDGNNKTWLEVTDTFYSAEWAKTILSSATPGEKKHPWKGGLQINMDEIFAERFVDNLHKKLVKKSYSPFAKKYGAGILLITLEYPWLSKETFDDIYKCCNITDWSDDISNFTKVYAVHPSMNKKAFVRLRYA